MANIEAKEAEYYIAQADGTVVCRICPHECRIGEGKHGLCRSRVNRDGKLYSLAYGRVCALQIDPVEKKPLLHFHPGGDCLSLGAAGCNLSCSNCQNWTISQASPDEVPYHRLAPEQFAEVAVQQHCRLVAYTYTEPLTYIEYTRDCAEACRKAGLKNILVTAGYVNERPLLDLLPFIDAANVDLKSFSDEVYRRISHARLQPVLRTLERMRDAGTWIEITNLLIPGVNDDEAMIRRMCEWLVGEGFAHYPLHFSRFFPQYRLQDVPPTPYETLLRARDIARGSGMQFVYIGNTDLPDAENTYCPHCGQLLVERDGYRIVRNRLPEGKCPSCGTTIAGEWAIL